VGTVEELRPDPLWLGVRRVRRPLVLATLDVTRVDLAGPPSRGRGALRGIGVGNLVLGVAGMFLLRGGDETVYHRERFLRATSEGPTELDMRVLRARLEADLHELRGRQGTDPELYRPDDDPASQALARRLRAAGSWGIVYVSVRRVEGECVAVLRPRALSRCQQAQRLGYVWDGERITAVYEKKLLREL
jgi:hypothetical protein